MARICSAGTLDFRTTSRVAAARARMCSSCDWVAYSGSSRLRWRGYSAMAEASRPRSLSTMETRTLNVPKSTPATTAIYVLLWNALCQYSLPLSGKLRLSSGRELEAVSQAENQQERAPPDVGMQIEKDNTRIQGRRRNQLPDSRAHDQDAVHEQGNTHEEHRHHRGPKRGPVINGDRRLVWNRSHSVDQPVQFGIALGFGHAAHDDRDHHANDPRPQRPVHILRHVASVGGKRDIAQRRRIDFDPCPHADGRNGSRKKTPEAAGAGRALPEHA